MENLRSRGGLLLLNPAAGAEGGPETAQEVGLLLGVEVSEHRPDGSGSLVGVVEGNAREQVVNDVGVNDAVEEVGANETKVAVNGAQIA